MYTCIYTPDFAVQAALRLRPELRRNPVVILDGEPPTETVFATNSFARRSGVACGMSRLQAESFPCVQILRRSRAQEESAQSALLSCAAIFSPRIESIARQHSPEPGGTFVLDIRGTERLFGDVSALAHRLQQRVAAYGFLCNVASSENFYAAVCTARGLRGATLLTAGQEAAVLGPLPLHVLDPSPEIAEAFHLWGIHTCEQLAALPERDLIARTGGEGQRLRLLARGEQRHLLVPLEASFESELVEFVELDYPVEELEPLLFLFARMLDQLLLRVQSRSLAIESVSIQLKQEREGGGEPTFHRRVIRPAVPSQDARRLLKLIQLDLETHPPSAAILAIEMRAVPAKPKTEQHGLFLPQGPEPGQLDVLLARLRMLLGEQSVGAPELLDTHRPDAFHLSTFAPPAPTLIRTTQIKGAGPAILRICRPPKAIRVFMADNKPAGVALDGESLTVRMHAGPWRKCGEWWSRTNWCREEWDVVLSSQTTEKVCRIARDPGSQCWYLEGTYD